MMATCAKLFDTGKTRSAQRADIDMPSLSLVVRDREKRHWHRESGKSVVLPYRN
jgi:hypothetical protein